MQKAQTITKKDLNKLRTFYLGRKGFIKIVQEKSGIGWTTLYNALKAPKNTDKSEQAINALIDFMAEKLQEAAKKRKEREQKLSNL